MQDATEYYAPTHHKKKKYEDPTAELKGECYIGF